MMEYMFTYDRFGAQFSVPFSLVGKYLKSCGEARLKVLLCILAGESRVSSEELSELSGAALSEVEEAVAYWTSLGIIGQEGTVPEKRTTVPVSVVEPVKPTRAAVVKQTYTYTPKEIKEKAENDAAIKKLLDEVQSVMGVTLNAHESNVLIELYEYYKFDIPSILMGAQYCRSSEKLTIPYLSAVMKRWYEEGITSCADIEKELIRRTDEMRYENQVKRLFGLESKLSKRQKEMIESWHGMGVALELVEIAYNKCMDTNNKLAFNYIDKIITDWVSSGIKTPEEVEEDDKRFRAEKKENTSDSSSYDLDEIEQFAMSYTITDDEG